MKKGFLIIIGYIGLTLFTWAGLNAYWQGRFYCVEKDLGEDNYRYSLVGNLGFALLPPMWVAAPFSTGFYQNGFSLGHPTCPTLQAGGQER